MATVVDSSATVLPTKVKPSGSPVPDVYSEQFAKDIRAQLELLRKRVREDPWCVGVFVDNELAWGDVENAGEVAEKYYSTVKEAMREILPNHLYLGSRFHRGGTDVWRAIPGELSLQDKRFSPGAVGKNVRMRDLDASFEWLRSAMTVNLAYHSADPNVGFGMTADHEGMKCYMVDTGLLASHAYSDNPETTKELLWKILTGKIELNKGMLMENMVAQMLRAAGRELYFHKTFDRKDETKRMEIDFLLTKSKISSRHNVVPIEVKSSRDYTTVSLERFANTYPGCCGCRIVLHPGDADFSKDIVYLPLYMAPLLSTGIDACK